ncbi:NUDIX domain-containing protein [Streptomyces tsukubensis]|uniref:NUDIX domain-containing protein n=1 Tax=Streptomyces tsukubensis TaxID=83656 RepID=UPI0036A47E67
MENETHARPQVSAGALIGDGTGGFLIVKPGYKAGWNLPGGRVNDGETPSAGCRREIAEELDLELTVQRLLVSAYFVQPDGGSHIYYVYDAGELAAEQQGSMRIQEGEIEAYRFAVPDSIGPNEIPPAVRPLWQAALAARTDGTTRHIELQP